MSLMYEFQELKLIYKTISTIYQPMLSLMGALMIVYYVFALIGMKKFGGMIKKDSFT